MDNNVVPPIKDDVLPDWLKDTVVKEPELLPPPSPRVLVKPAILAVLIVLMVATSVGAFFLTRKKPGEFGLQKRAVQLEKISCPVQKDAAALPAVKCDPNVMTDCCPRGDENDRGATSGTVDFDFGFGFPKDTANHKCLAGVGQEQTYSAEIIRCGDNNFSNCKYAVAEARVNFTCNVLTVKDDGTGFFNYRYSGLAPGCYQVDVCPAGPGQSCYESEGDVVYGFRTAVGGVNCEPPTATNTPTPPACPYDLSLIGINQTETVGKDLTIYAQSTAPLESPKMEMLLDGVLVRTLNLVPLPPANPDCSSGKCNHKFEATGPLSVGTYTFVLKTKDIECARRTVQVGGATCVSIIAFKEGTNHLTGLKAGEQVRFVITPSGAVEGAVVRLSKGGVKVADLATVIYEATKYSALYTIPAGGEGNYEALGFVKVGGIWK